MKQKRHAVDQLIAKLRRADMDLVKIKMVPEVCKLNGVIEQKSSRRRRKSEGMRLAMTMEFRSSLVGERSAEGAGGGAGPGHEDPEGSREGNW